MEKVKYLILGAGPAGLAFANRLKEQGEEDFLVLEKEDEAGGLCRSAEVDGAPLDIGGGHFLDVRRPEVVRFLFRFLPEKEWDVYTRDSRISFHGGYISHPFEANIWQMDEADQRVYLESIAKAGCNTGKPMPDEFVDWIFWKLGDRIAEDYMLPYNRKMFGKDLNLLGTYWLSKLPNVSYEETKLSCANHRAYGKQPGHARFYYPKRYGYGELWRRMGEALGDNLRLSCPVRILDVDARQVSAGEGEVYQAERIICTIPWTAFERVEGLPEEIGREMAKLRHSSIRVEYFPDNMDTEAQWIYYPEPELAYHRILVRHNFCPGSRGYWTETNLERAGETDNWKYDSEYAYPLNTADKPVIMGKLLSWAEERQVYGLGRWGEWEHYNSDAVVERAMKLADRSKGIS